MLQTRQGGNLPFNFGGMIKRSMPPRFKAPCSLWRVFADVFSTCIVAKVGTNDNAVTSYVGPLDRLGF